MSQSRLRYSGKFQNKAHEVQATNIALVLFVEDDVHIAYAPALDLSGYGKTEEEARASWETTLREFLHYTTTKKTLTAELRKLGWRFSGKDLTVVRAPAIEELASTNEALKSLTRSGNPLRVVVKPVNVFSNGLTV